jgi:hypothetical protein
VSPLSRDFTFTERVISSFRASLVGAHLAFLRALCDQTEKRCQAPHYFRRSGRRRVDGPS